MVENFHVNIIGRQELSTTFAISYCNIILVFTIYTFVFQRSYLQNFGYLKKGQPEMANLLMGDVAQSYEDDFRIAIKTLQVGVVL